MIHPLDTIVEGIGTSFLIWYQYLALKRYYCGGNRYKFSDLVPVLGTLVAKFSW